MFGAIKPSVLELKGGSKEAGELIKYRRVSPALHRSGPRFSSGVVWGHFYTRSFRLFTRSVDAKRIFLVLYRPLVRGHMIFLKICSALLCLSFTIHVNQNPTKRAPNRSVGPIHFLQVSRFRVQAQVIRKSFEFAGLKNCVSGGPSGEIRMLNRL